MNTTKTRIMVLNTKHFEEAKCEGNEIRSKMCIIIGEKGYILTDNECIHYCMKLDEKVEMEIWARPRLVDSNDPSKGTTLSIFPCGNVTVSLPELVEFSNDETPDWKKWIHYFGIKDRMLSNLRLLKKSIKEIGAEVEFPAW